MLEKKRQHLSTSNYIPHPFNAWLLGYFHIYFFVVRIQENPIRTKKVTLPPCFCDFSKLTIYSCKGLSKNLSWNKLWSSLFVQWFPDRVLESNSSTEGIFKTVFLWERFCLELKTIMRMTCPSYIFLFTISPALGKLILERFTTRKWFIRKWLFMTSTFTHHCLSFLTLALIVRGKRLGRGCHRIFPVPKITGNCSGTGKSR